METSRTTTCVWGASSCAAVAQFGTLALGWRDVCDPYWALLSALHAVAFSPPASCSCGDPHVAPWWASVAAEAGLGAELPNVVSINERTMRSHHGALRVTSALEKGTAFRVWFPLEPEVVARDGGFDSGAVSS